MHFLFLMTPVYIFVAHQQESLSLHGFHALLSIEMAICLKITKVRDWNRSVLCPILWIVINSRVKSSSWLESKKKWHRNKIILFSEIYLSSFGVSIWPFKDEGIPWCYNTRKGQAPGHILKQYSQMPIYYQCFL